MKKILFSMAAVSALAVGAPAMAQQGGGYGVSADTRIDVRIGELQSRLQAGVQQGSITRQEAQPLRMQLRELTRLERQYARDGLSRTERQDLQQRVQTLRQQIRMAEGGRGGGQWNGRQGADVRDGGYDEDDRYASPYDRDRDGYDDRDTNRDNRVDSRDGNYDRDGDYRDGERRGGIVGDVIDRVTGNGGLRVGQRVSGNLGVLPYEYRNQYRDGNGAYYRTDGRNIYRIDARTEVVLQVHAMNR
jgi:hypothetical protein